MLLRHLFNEIIFWSEEAIIYLVIFSTFLGAVITLRHNEHVNVDIFAAFLKERGKRVMALIATVVTLVYLGVHRLLRLAAASSSRCSQLDHHAGAGAAAVGGDAAASRSA